MDREKQVDESWKETAKTETGHDESCACGHEHDAGEHAIEINFTNYITSLGFQALIFMGVIPNPMTNESDKNFIQAKFIIDTLCMLKEKTKGNLSNEESGLLESSIAELQMKYVEVIKSEQTQAGPEKTKE